MSRHLKFPALSPLASLVMVATCGCSSGTAAKLPSTSTFPQPIAAQWDAPCAARGAWTRSATHRTAASAAMLAPTTKPAWAATAPPPVPKISRCAAICVSTSRRRPNTAAPVARPVPAVRHAQTGACTTACPGSTVVAPVFTNEGPSTACVSVVTDSNNCGAGWRPVRRWDGLRQRTMRQLLHSSRQLQRHLL